MFFQVCADYPLSKLLSRVPECVLQAVFGRQRDGANEAVHRGNTELLKLGRVLQHNTMQSQVRRCNGESQVRHCNSESSQALQHNTMQVKSSTATVKVKAGTATVKVQSGTATVSQVRHCNSESSQALQQ